MTTTMTLSKSEISQMCEAAFDRLFIKNQSCVMRAMKIYTIRKAKSDRYIWLFTDYLRLIPKEFKEQDLLEILAESPFKEEQSTEISYTQEVVKTQEMVSLDEEITITSNDIPTEISLPSNSINGDFDVIEKPLSTELPKENTKNVELCRENTENPKSLEFTNTQENKVDPITFDEILGEFYQLDDHVSEISDFCSQHPYTTRSYTTGTGIVTIINISKINLAFEIPHSRLKDYHLTTLEEIIKKVNLKEPNLQGIKGLQGELFDFYSKKESLNPKTFFILVDDKEKLESAIALLSSAKSIAIDTETTGLDPYTNKLRLIQLATSEQTFIIDCFQVAIEPLAKLFDNPDIVVIGHNLSFDLKFLQRAGIKTKCKLFDTMIAYKLLNSGLGKEASLKNVLQDILGIEIDKSEQKSNWSSEELSQTQLDYAATDVVNLPKLYDKLKKQLIDNKLVSVAKLEFDCILAVVEMELSGFLLDAAKWEQHKIVAIDMLQEISDRLIALLGNINFNSAQQIKTALSSAGIKVQKTDYETLAPLAAQYPEIATLLEYKKISSLINKFLKGYLEKLNPVSGRLHSSFNQMGAETGRFSSNNPNLQQIPRNKDIRSCFIAAPGNKLIIADYGQIELRIAAEISQDSQMIKAFNNGEDLHKLTASLVLGKPLEQVTKSDRQIAKSLNFGLLYGMGAEGLQQYALSSYGVNLSKQEAQSYRDKFFRAYQGLGKWHYTTKNRLSGHKIRVTETLGGRKRNGISGVTDMLNTPVQGTGADILKVALGELARVLPSEVKLIACVHDEIVLECPDGIVDEVKAILTSAMIQAGEKYIKAVPVEVDVSVGDSWGDKG